MLQDIRAQMATPRVAVVIAVTLAVCARLVVSPVPDPPPPVSPEAVAAALAVPPVQVAPLEPSLPQLPLLGELRSAILWQDLSSELDARARQMP